MFNQLADLSTTFGDILQKDKKSIDKIETEIALDILTRGVSPELEARFRGERDYLMLI